MRSVRIGLANPPPILAHAEVSARSFVARSRCVVYAVVGRSRWVVYVSCASFLPRPKTTRLSMLISVYDLTAIPSCHSLNSPFLSH